MPSKKSSVIILVGMMGSGKSTVGALLAKQLNYNYMDTDDLIERSENLSIKELFQSKGESHFRALESNIIESITSQKVVVSTGGGLPIYNDNMKQLLKMGTTFYLKISAAEIYFRLKNSENRPLFENNIAQIQTLLSSRKKVYETAKYHIDCTAKKPLELIEEIKFKINH